MDNRCAYLSLNGARCTMPALRGANLCFHHDRLRALARVKPSYPGARPTVPLVSFSYMDDHTSILANLNAIARAFAEHHIDHRQVTALTYLMQTSLKTLRQMKQLETAIIAEEMPTDVVYDQDNQPLAAPKPGSVPESEATPEPGSEPAAEPALPFTPDPQPASAPAPDAILPASFQTLAENKTVTPLLPTLSDNQKTTDAFSDTCIEKQENSFSPYLAVAARKIAEEEQQWRERVEAMPVEDQIKAIHDRYHRP